MFPLLEMISPTFPFPAIKRHNHKAFEGDYHNLPLIRAPLTANAEVLMDRVPHVTVEAEAFSCKHSEAVIQSRVHYRRVLFNSLCSSFILLHECHPNECPLQAAGEHLISSFLITFFHRIRQRKLAKFSSRTPFSSALAGKVAVAGGS